MKPLLFILASAVAAIPGPLAGTSWTCAAETPFLLSFGYGKGELVANVGAVLGVKVGRVVVPFVYEEAGEGARMVFTTYVSADDEPSPRAREATVSALRDGNALVLSDELVLGDEQGAVRCAALP